MFTYYEHFFCYLSVLSLQLIMQKINSAYFLHQVDMRGNLFGVLAAHPLSPLCSLHHLDAAQPLFPDMNRTQALRHLIAATNVDPTRILQQTVCYDRSNSLTFSVSWGYAIQVFQGNVLLPDLLAAKKTFAPWRKIHSNFMFDTRDNPRDPCKRPFVFYLKSITSDKSGIWSSYSRYVEKKCSKSNPTLPMEITVFSRKLDLSIEEVLLIYCCKDIYLKVAVLFCIPSLSAFLFKLFNFMLFCSVVSQMKAPRRQCCNVLPSKNETISIHIRRCETDELISMEL